jgi:hypothetical protein
MTFFETLTLVLGGVSVILILLQVNIAFRSVREDHRRRRRQATIEFFLSSMRPVWRDGLIQMRERWGKGPLAEKALAEIESDPRARYLVVNLLDNLEIMAVAVDSEIYDKGTMIRLAGPLLAQLHRKLKPFMVKQQQLNPKQFCEYERLAKECEVADRCADE